MQELVKYLVSQLVENEDSVEVVLTDEGSNTIVNINCAKEEIGKIIGKQGRIAKAIRTIVKACGIKQGVHYSVEINEK
ncbi:MAG: KH domain-containing protein [Clostridia bacterium]